MTASPTPQNPIRQSSILGLIPLFQTMASLGYDTESLMSDFGIDLERVTGAALITEQQQLEIAEKALKQINDPLFGLKVGKQMSFSTYGVYAMLVMSAPTIHEACLCGLEFQQLSFTYGVMSLHLDKSVAQLRYHLPDKAPDLRRFIVDRELMAATNFVREMISESELATLRYGVARERPSDEREYQRISGIKPVYDQPFNWIQMPKYLLMHKMKHSDRLAHGLYKIQANELLQKYYPERQGITDQIQHLLDGYSGKFPDIVQIARHLKLSERTLKRRLAALGTSFREQLQCYRCDKAKQLLQQGTPVGLVANRLGYEESSSFIRAFQRWTHMSPSAWLKHSVQSKIN